MTRRLQRSDVTDLTSFVFLIIGLIVVGFIVVLLARTQRGLIGVVLAIAAGVLLIYWLRELRRTMKKELMLAALPLQKKDLFCDIIDGADGVTVVAEVPGPEDKVKVELNHQALEIKGGLGFQRTLNLAKHTEISTVTYVNGVLTVRLRKIEGT